MQKDHPQAQKAMAFEQAALPGSEIAHRAARAAPVRGYAVLASQRSLSLNNDSVFTALRTGMTTSRPRLYAARDVAARRSHAERQQHGLSLEEDITCFRGFQDPDTCLRILAPERDIDSTCLGQFATANRPFSDPSWPKRKLTRLVTEKTRRPFPRRRLQPSLARCSRKSFPQPREHQRARLSPDRAAGCSIPRWPFRRRMTT